MGGWECAAREAYAEWNQTKNSSHFSRRSSIEKTLLKWYITQVLFLRKEVTVDSIKNSNSDNWQSLSPAEKKLELFRRQKDLLDTFLATGAISQAQHDKSLNCLIEKMGIKEDQQ
jgi:hypothetical protein